MERRPDQSLASFGALVEPLRRALYLYVVAQPDAVSRDDAAGALQISRGLAAHHLDRLVAAGLLEVEFRRLSNRTGPGAGRPSKLYRRSGVEAAVSLPHREYELVARLLAEAVEEAGDRPVRPVLHAAAERWGRSLAADAAPDAPPLAAVVGVLDAYGFEPSGRDQEVVLRNCPFHGLAQRHTELVCGLNLSLVTGIATGVGGGKVEAVLDPRPGHCCVVVRSKKN